MRVTSPKVIRELLSENGLNPLKKFGQNFLTDQNIVEKIAEAASPENSRVLEIGMGLGALTDALCRRDTKVIAIEIDKGLVSLAEKTQCEHENLTVIKEDVLDVDLPLLAKEYFDGESFYVCGNLPYYITAPVIMKILESSAPISALTAMVQKEVANRLSSKPKDNDYGAITALADYFGGARLLFNVSKNCFYPVPKVSSAVIKIDILKEREVPFDEYRKIVKAAFAMRRKTIFNNLKALFGSHTEKILKDSDIDLNARAQQLSCDDYINIAKTAQKYTELNI